MTAKWNRTLEDPRRQNHPHLSNLTLDLDEAGWREANALLNSCLEGLMRIGGEAKAATAR